ncbi:MAG: hypothetical protein JO187_04570 [Acidobacteria bacterium]|nr:hypothetical protein [Acidobacteriota bacterium]
MHSLYNTAKLDGNHLASFPQFVSSISNPATLDKEKALLFMQDCAPQQIACALPIRAILVPRVTGQKETRVQKGSPATALAAMAPSTIFQLPRAGASTFKYLASFVSTVPCFRLECGTDLAQIAATIEALLRETSG